MVNNEPLHFLLVTQDPEAIAICEESLSSPQYILQHYDSLAAALQPSCDVAPTTIFLDYDLVYDESLEAALFRWQAHAPQAEIVLLADEMCLDEAVDRLYHCVCDILAKPLMPAAVRTCLVRLEKVRQAKQHAAEVEHLAAIGQRVAVLTHEGRNVLQLMQANLELLGARLGDLSEATEYHARLQRSQDHLYRMFDDLRGYAMPLLLRRQACDVQALLHQVAQRVSLARGRQLHLQQADCPTELWCSVDPFRMDQVFRNLLENSLDACPDPVCVQITCRETQMGEKLALQIALRDNGPGLSAEQREKIFLPFYTTKLSGTGLGTSIARRIVEAHGGELRLGSATDSGVEFILTLPLHEERTSSNEREAALTKLLSACRER